MSHEHENDNIDNANHLRTGIVFERSVFEKIYRQISDLGDDAYTWNEV